MSAMDVQIANDSLVFASRLSLIPDAERYTHGHLWRAPAPLHWQLEICNWQEAERKVGWAAYSAHTVNEATGLYVLLAFPAFDVHHRADGSPMVFTGKELREYLSASTYRGPADWWRHHYEVSDMPLE